MTRSQLEHAIRAACDIADDTEVIIFGSQAILGTYANPPESITASIEVDLQPKNKPANTDLVDGALGECSQFHETHGFYVHGLAIDSATLPSGWEDRTVPVSDPHTTRGNIGHCLEAHDLATSKLLANREKDRIFVTTLLMERLIDGNTLLERVEMLIVDPVRRQSMFDWIRITMQDLR
jgi:hypothetical protein